jgi:hypothetical protein
MNRDEFEAKKASGEMQDGSIEEWAIRAASALMVMTHHHGLVGQEPEHIEESLQELVCKIPTPLMMVATMAIGQSVEALHEAEKMGFTINPDGSLSAPDIPDFPPENFNG